MTFAKINRPLSIFMIFLLSFSIVSLGPFYFGSVAATEDAEEMDDQEHEQESERHDSEKDHADEETHVDEEGRVLFIKHLAENSMVTFKAEKQLAQVLVHVEKGDFAEGSYNVTVACESPDSSLTFKEKLNVVRGSGEFASRMTLGPGTYSGCIISVGNVPVMIPSFTIVSNAQHGHSHGHSHGTEAKAESKVDIRGDDVIIFEGTIVHRGFEAGTYDIVLSCDQPEGWSFVFNDTFTMDHEGKGKLLIETSFGPGSYNGCEASIMGSDADMVVATFKPFRVTEQNHEADGKSIDDKRHEKRQAILERAGAGEIHRRHVEATQVSRTSDYEPGMNYDLAAVGNGGGDLALPVDVKLDLGLWKSNRAVALMDVLDGEVAIGDDVYTVRVGYSIYSFKHDVLSLRALATHDNTGEIVQLKMRGHATSDDALLPTQEGKTLELHFEGNNGRSFNHIGSWELFLEGTITA